MRRTRSEDVTPVPSVGLPADTATTCTPSSYFGQRILGDYGSEPAHVAELVSLVRHGRLDLSRSIPGTLPLAHAARGVEMFARKEGRPRPAGAPALTPEPLVIGEWSPDTLGAAATRR